MFTLPNTKAFASDFFDCNDIGVLLNEQGIDKDKDGVIDFYVPGNNFEELTFHDDIMTDSYYPQGRVTNFTLHFLKDTGFYTSIKLGAADKTFFKKGDGCDAALGSRIAP